MSIISDVEDVTSVVTMERNSTPISASSGHVSSEELMGNCDPVQYTDHNAEDNKQRRPSTAFTVVFDDKKNTRRRSARPRRTQHQSHNKPATQIPLVDYTREESRMMADIVREAMINDVREKAKYNDVKLYDAQRRRMYHDYRKEQMQKIEIERRTADATDRRKLVKHMADETRRKAAQDRLFASGRNSRTAHQD